MKFVIFILSFIFAIPSFASVPPRKITIGFIPVIEKNQQEEELLTLAKIIQSQLQIPLDIYLAKDYQSLVSAIYSKKVDFAFLTAMSYASMKKQSEVKVLMQKVWNQGSYYHSAIVVKPNSKIQSLQDLKSKKIAFVDKKSTSGFLLPMIELMKQGVSIKDLNYKFYGTHKAAMDALNAGEVEAVASFSSDEKANKGAWTHLYEKPIEVRKLWVSQAIPSDPFVVRKDFYISHPNTSHRLMYVLRDLNDTQPGLPLLILLKTNTLKPSTSRPYKKIRSLATQIEGIKI